MFQPYLEELARFAAEGDLASELPKAKQEFIQRTGDLFETDASFERRIAAFLEWYTLDRAMSFRPDLTPAKLFVLMRGPGLPDAERDRYAGLTQSSLSLFEYKKPRPEGLLLRDLLTGEKVEVFERRRPAGLESGDILEARLLPFDGRLMVSEAYHCPPREARKEILAAAKRWKKRGDGDAVSFVHRVAYFSNRSERYKHLKPKAVFAELNAKAA